MKVKVHWIIDGVAEIDADTPEDAEKKVEQTEKDLKRLFPMDKWNKLHLQIIFYGREFCPARGHDLEKCIICFKHRRKNNFK